MTAMTDAAVAAVALLGAGAGETLRRHVVGGRLQRFFSSQLPAPAGRVPSIPTRPPATTVEHRPPTAA